MRGWKKGVRVFLNCIYQFLHYRDGIREIFSFEQVKGGNKETLHICLFYRGKEGLHHVSEAGNEIGIAPEFFAWVILVHFHYDGFQVIGGHGFWPFRLQLQVFHDSQQFPTNSSVLIDAFEKVDFNVGEWNLPHFGVLWSFEYFWDEPDTQILQIGL